MRRRSNKTQCLDRFNTRLVILFIGTGDLGKVLDRYDLRTLLEYKQTYWTSDAKSLFGGVKKSVSV